MKRFAILVLAIVALGVGAVAWGLWHAFHEMAAVRLVVMNATTRPIDSVTIEGDPLGRMKPYVEVGRVAPGRTRVVDWHMPGSLGSVWLRVRTPRGSSVADAGQLLDDDGPYEFRVRVDENGATFERDNNEPTTWASTMPSFLP